MKRDALCPFCGKQLSRDHCCDRLSVKQFLDILKSDGDLGEETKRRKEELDLLLSSGKIDPVAHWYGVDSTRAAFEMKLSETEWIEAMFRIWRESGLDLKKPTEDKNSAKEALQRLDVWPWAVTH